MKGYLIGVKNELLEKKHIKQMGESIWLYLWILDKVTSISEEDIGKVLSGRPVKCEEVCAELGISEATYSRWVAKLKKGNYIDTLRVTYGLVITVNKAHKIFGLRSELSHAKPELSQAKERVITSDKSNIDSSTNSNKDNREPSLSKESEPEKETEIWKANKQYIEEHKAKWADEKFNYPTPDGLYDWRYLLDHGQKCSPGKLFGALYWQEKERLSNGVFSYKFRNSRAAWKAFFYEKENAEELARMFTVSEFMQKLKQMDTQHYDDAKGKYWLDWKLSTILKNLHNG